MLSPKNNNSLFESPSYYKKWIGEKSGNWKLDLYQQYKSDDSLRSIGLTELFDEFLPNTSVAFQIFDTTCHIMMELACVEKNGIFEVKNLDNLAKQAISSAYIEKKLDSNTKLSEEAENNIAAIALWNLLLPKSEGGIFPDEDYEEFIKHVAKQLQVFKPITAFDDSESINFITITPKKLRDSLHVLKKLSLETFAIQNDNSDPENTMHLDK